MFMTSSPSSSFQKTILPSGVRVVTETMPHVHSLSVGFWFNTGSRDEPDRLAGIAHYLEHMNFKGTARRSPIVIAREIESRGGHLNAFTTKETTCYFARVTDEHLTRAVDVLADLTLHSLYDPEETERERQVILEELKSVEDTPDELVFEQFLGDIYSRHPLGRSVLGTRESLTTIDSPALKEYSQANYGGSGVVIAAAGNLNHQRLVRLIEHRFKRECFSPQTLESAGTSVDRSSRLPPEEIQRSDFRADRHTNTQQAHLAVGCRS
ncbi:MAG: pitrilysin family protein, partial [Calditrichota bacterium]